jgi:hypothetical protein
MPLLPRTGSLALPFPWDVRCRKILDHRGEDLELLVLFRADADLKPYAKLDP